MCSSDLGDVILGMVPGASTVEVTGIGAVEMSVGGALVLNSDLEITPASILSIKVAGTAVFGVITGGNSALTVTAGDDLTFQSASGVSALSMTSGDDLTMGTTDVSGPFAMIAAGSIFQNSGSTETSSTSEPSFFVAITGTVGTAEEPIIIECKSSQTFVGAAEVAYLEGHTLDDKVYCDPNDPPQGISLNGVMTYCTMPPPVDDVPANAFFVAGATTRQGSLAGDMYFLPDFITEETVDGGVMVFYIPSKGNRKVESIRRR